MPDAPEGNGSARSPLDHVLDLFVFAPLGLLADSHALVPKLAESGRQHVDNRVQLARMVGQFAVQQGRQHAAKVVAGLRASNAGPHAATASAPTTDEPIVDDDVDESAAARVGVDDGGISEDDLAIPSYDSLAASQVVPRLGGLSSIELEAVRRYEEAHRGRRTVLGKIANLQQGP